MKSKMPSTLRALFIASEAGPFVKIGGLGDVAESLPQALLSLNTDTHIPGGIDIRLVIPFHHVIERSSYDLRVVTNFEVPHRDGDIPAEVFVTSLNGLSVYLIDSPIMPKDGMVYHSDAGLDGPKYTFFSLAALQLARQLDWKPHILHANDWHTAPAVYALSLTRGQDPFFANTATLLTIHNLPYLGSGTEGALSAFGLPPTEDPSIPRWARHLPLPLGLLTADHISTVSQGYAQEILTPEFGSGLHDFLKTRAESISGILNGIDTERWNPMEDPSIAVNYNRIDLIRRKKNKSKLQAELGLTQDADVPLLAMVTRMDYQKGVDLVPNALSMVADLPWQIVILGTGDPGIEAAIRAFAKEYSNRVQAAIRFDAPLARRIYSGADVLLIPSRYEPCGLTQMIAMRYGGVPIARKTGGLADTISDYQEDQVSKASKPSSVRRRSTGFLFKQASHKALARAIQRAIHVYEDQRRWRGMQLRAMKKDFSWENSARQYLQLYQSLATKKQAIHVQR
jgi:starch synthase